MRGQWIGAALAAALCVVPAARATAQDAALTAPTAMSAATASGAGFAIPPAWTKSERGGVTVLTAPEGDAHIAVVDVPGAADASAAAAAAWRLYKPDFKRPVQLASPLPAIEGWDERVVIAYETSPAEHVAVQALALRKGDAWTAMLLEGNEATVAKRGAQLNLVIQSMRPAGYEKESFAGKTAHPIDAARVAAMKDFVATSIAQLGIPGAAFALIDDGKLVYEGGVGVRELGESAPVDAETLFMVASNTKGMSTLLLSELVDEGKIAWDAPVTSVYPEFRLGSDATTKSVLVKHLVCACTGLPRKDFQWLLNTSRATPANDTFVQLAATQPTSGFGEVFQYNNLMASAAGYVGGHLVYPDMELGAAYDRAMREKIFEPLGMEDTTFDMARALAANHATPHADNVDGEPAVIPMGFNYTVMPYRPAGGAWSNAHDMIRYVGNELSGGVLPGGKRLVSEASLKARRQRYVPVGENSWYGMGLQEDAKTGVSMFHHGGSLFGYKSDIMFVPSAGVGAVILTNSDNGQMLLRPFKRRLLELLYDGRPEAAADVASAAARDAAQEAKFRERLVIPPAPQAAAMLASAYRNPDLGQLKVVRGDGGKLRFAMTSGASSIASRANDDGTTSFITTDSGLIGLDFVAGEKDGKRTLTTNDGQHEYVFVAKE